MSALAYHEAAHAVIAWRHELRVESVTIVPGKGYSGRAFCNTWATTPVARIKISLAGFCADLRIVQRDGPQPGASVSGSDTDFGVAHGSAVQAFGLDADRRMGELMTETLAEVDADWELIERLARALDERLVLDEGEILGLLADEPA